MVAFKTKWPPTFGHLMAKCIMQDNSRQRMDLGCLSDNTRRYAHIFVLANDLVIESVYSCTWKS